MATKKTKAMIIAMAAIVGTTNDGMNEAAAAALRDIKNEMGSKKTYSISTPSPFDLNYDWLGSENGDSYA